MEVQVDEPGKHVHPGGVDLLRGLLGPAGRAHVTHRGSDGDDRLDAVPLDHDVHGPAGRCTGAIDQRGVPDDEPLERTFALGAVRRRAGIGSCVLGEHGAQRCTGGETK